MSLELRRRLMVQAEPKDIIIDARKGGVSGDAANDSVLMGVIFAKGWSKSPLYMTKREAEAVPSISSVFNQIKQNYSFEAFQYFTLIKSIDNSCFNGSNASYLTKLSLPYSVTSINKNAFAGCTRLNLVIPENSLLKTIGDGAFRMIASASLYIPKLVSSISNNAFAGASIISFIVSDENTIYRSENHCIIKDNIIVAGGLDFDGTQSMSDTIDTIGVNAFNSRGLSKIIIPKGITTLQNSCYYSNTNAKSLYIPDTVISIAHDSFNICSKLESIEVEAANQKYESINNTLIEKDSGTLIIGCKNSTIPSDVITLSDYCFYDCEGLETIDIPDSVTTIGTQAFDNIASLKKVTIGSGVSKINNIAFFRTNNLGKIKINATAPPTITSNSFTTKVIIYVPDESVETYKKADIWSTMIDRIKPISEYTE